MQFFLKIIYNFLVLLGLFSWLFLISGVFFDFRGIDKTNSNEASLSDEIYASSTNLLIIPTKDGVIKKGTVSDYHINCFTGVLSLKIHGGTRFDYTKLFEPFFYKEVFKIYTPQEACVAGGVEPEF